MNFGNHFGGEEERNTGVHHQRDVNQITDLRVGVRSITTDGHQRYQSTESEESSNPGFVDPFDVGALIERLLRPIVGQYHFCPPQALLSSQHLTTVLIKYYNQ